MSITERKLRHKEELRSLILDTAWEMVIDNGWPTFSIRKVADAIEYSVTVIYSHFENKDAILLEFIKKGFQLLVEEISKARIGQKSLADEIEAIAHAYLNFAFNNQQYYQLMFGLGIPTSATAHNFSQMSGFREVLVSSISTFTPEDKEARFDPSLKYLTFLSMMHGLVSINMLAKPSCKCIGLESQVEKALIHNFVTGLIAR